MPDDSDAFHTTIELESPEHRGYLVALRDVVVDHDAALSWIPSNVLDELGIPREKRRQFRQSDGTTVSRSSGYVIVHVAGTETSDEVIFGESGDVVLLGARSLEGLNLKVQPVTKQLVDAGPVPAAPVGSAV
jgi:predicted aspartyl protease